jgi:hypothetical protein
VSDPLDAAPAVRSVVLLLGVLWAQRNSEGPLGTIDTLVSCLVGEKSSQAARPWWLAWSLFSLVTYLAGLLAVAGLALALVRAVRWRGTARVEPVTSSHAGGVVASRGKETLAAVVPVAGAVALVATVLSLDRLGFWDWVDGAGGESFFRHPETAVFWLAFAVPALGMSAAVALAVVAVKPVLVRLRPDRRAVHAPAVTDR